MASRLTVIMIETAPPIPGASRLAEDIVGNVIGRPGIDLTLIRSLKGIAPNSTDQLTLDSITGDCAVLDWQPPEATLAALLAVGFTGQRAAHRCDLQGATQPSVDRRLYLFDLQPFDDASDVLAALESLKSARQTRTFTIGNLSSVPPVPGASRSSTGGGPVDAPPRHVARSDTGPNHSAPNGSTSKHSTPKNSTPKHSTPSSDPASELADTDLDDLIDQLDRSDT